MKGRCANMVHEERNIEFRSNKRIAFIPANKVRVIGAVL